ncbi:MAG: molecular chaperone TorD family protein [Coriobacteriales bacterium]|jgi:TorA maturation chaperone TorD|nr:molecular chaperone TorD family protein [Coriobacteriales bacterium]
MSPLPDSSARAYQVLLGLCGILIYTPPDAAALEVLRDQRGLFLEQPFSTVAPDAAKTLSDLLDGDVDDLRMKIANEHTFIFKMVAQSHASPYESVYRTCDSTLFGPTTLEVREAYRAHGQQFPRMAAEPDDHIGLELQFASTLLDKIASDSDEADAKTAEVAQRALRGFLAEHLLVFAPSCLGRVAEASSFGFYRAVAGIALAALTDLADALEVEATTSPLR